VLVFCEMGKLYNALVNCSVIFIVEGRFFMNKNNSEKTTKWSSKQEDNKEVSDASNTDATRMYNMPEMTSGPGDATLEERSRNSERSDISKNGTKK